MESTKICIYYSIVQQHIRDSHQEPIATKLSITINYIASVEQTQYTYPVKSFLPQSILVLEQVDSRQQKGSFNKKMRKNENQFSIQ